MAEDEFAAVFERAGRDGVLCVQSPDGDTEFGPRADHRPPTAPSSSAGLMPARP